MSSRSFTISREANLIHTPVSIARSRAWDGKKVKNRTMGPSSTSRAFHSPELSPHVLLAPLLRRLHRPGHWTRRIRSRVTARRIKEHTISDEWPSQFILIVVIFDINVQVYSAASQVDRFRSRKYRLPGSVCRCSATVRMTKRLPINSTGTHCRITDANRINCNTFRATRSSVSSSSSSLLVEPHAAKNITRIVTAHIRVMMRSMTLKGDFQNCCVPNRKARKPLDNRSEEQSHSPGRRQRNAPQLQQSCWY